MKLKPLSTLIFLLSSLLSLLSTTIASHHPHPNPNKPNSNFLWSSCLSTRYPPLCYNTLSRYAPKFGQSQRQLALTSLALSLSKARSTARFVSRIKKLKNVDPKELEAVKDCVNILSDGVDQLNRSFGELVNSRHSYGDDFMWHMNNVQTWVSAALTDESTCVDGLSSDGKSVKVKGLVQMKVNSVAQVTSNALALVNRFAAWNNVKNP